MDGCSILPEIQFVRTILCMDKTWLLSVGGSLPQLGTVGERPEFDIKPPLGASLQICHQGYLLKSSLQGDTSARSVFLLLGELQKATEPHLSVIPLVSRSHQMVFTYDQVIRSHHSYHPSGGLPKEKPQTCHRYTHGFACHCPVPVAWTTGASGQNIEQQRQTTYDC